MIFNKYIKINNGSDLIVYNNKSLRPVLLRNYDGNINSYFLKNLKKLIKYGFFKKIQSGKRKKVLTCIGFHITDFCNLNCSYCLRHEDLPKQKINEEKIRKCLSKYIQKYNSCDENVTIQVSGGEPFLCISEMKKIAKIVKQTLETYFLKKVTIDFYIVTNGTVFTKETEIFLEENNVKLGISIDFSKEAHDKNRITKSGKGTFTLIEENLKRILSYQEIETILVTVNKSNIDLFDIKEFVENCKIWKPKTITLQLDKEWNNQSLDVFYKLQTIVSELDKENINCFFEAQNIIKNYIDLINNNYINYSELCSFYNSNSLVIKYDGSLLRCPYYSDKKKSNNRECNLCGIKKICSGKCVTVEDDTDCHFRQMLFVSYLISNSKTLLILDR